MCGNEYHFRTGIVGHDPIQKFQSDNARHHLIEDYHLWTNPFKDF